MNLKLAKIVKAKSNDLNDLVKSIPYKYRRRADELCAFLYNEVRVDLLDITIQVNKKEKHILLIPHALVAIDMFEESIRSFIETEDYIEKKDGTKFDEFPPEFHQNIEAKRRWEILAKDIATTIHIDTNIKYKSLTDIINIKKGSVIIDPDFLKSITDSRFYNRLGFLDARECRILQDRYELENLFCLKDFRFESYDDSRYDKFPFTIPGEVADLCIYTFTFDSFAFSKDYSVLREIPLDSVADNIEDGSQRYVFTTFMWQWYIKMKGVALPRKKKTISLGDERRFPLVFHGLYKYDQKESEKEGLNVWKRISTKIDIPLSWEEFNKSQVSYFFLPKETWEKKGLTSTGVLTSLNLSKHDFIKTHVCDSGIYIYVEFPYQYSEAIKIVTECGYGNDIVENDNSK